MKLHKYESYDNYFDNQVKKNKKKLKLVGVSRKEIKIVSKYIKKNIPGYKFGICHGARNGWEVKQFRKALDIKVIGTDISPTAKMFNHIIQWDFHEVKDKWINNVDFIFSNALDHSYKPKDCLKQWMRCLTSNGLCFLSWNYSHGPEHVDSGDPFGATFKEYQDMISEDHFIVKTIEFGKHSGKPEHSKRDYIIVISNKK
jgi:hypothetical protein